jgi:perosamine synthetase
MNKKHMNEYPLLDPKDGIPLFYPHVPKDAAAEVAETLSGRWIGQGPKVDKFEKFFKEKFLGNYEALAVGSGTDALHLSYLFAGVSPGDEVIVPVFTCTATNIPLLYIGATPVFADIDPQTMNISPKDVEKRITSRTKAIVCVDYGGVPCDYEALNVLCYKYGLKLISDAAHSLGTKYKGQYCAQMADFTIFSFQAIKTLTTGDGGIVAIKDSQLLDLGKKLRWFGIDRTAKQGGNWENDIIDIGYKYQMNDIAASIGLAGLREIDQTIYYRNQLFQKYKKGMHSPRVRIVDANNSEDIFNSAWMLTVIIDKDRIGLMDKLRENGVESGQVHYRNDRYTIFGGLRDDLPYMDDVEERYLVLPLHTKMDEQHVQKICDIVNSGW